MAPASVAESCTALATIVDSTVSRSSVELTAWLTSPSACSSRYRARELVGPRVQLLSRRVFSMAITAWSAKVRSVASCFSDSGPGATRTTLRAPIAASPRSIGMIVTAR